MSVATADPGSIAWVITATALVMLMTPALGFFYGGQGRRKNLVSTIAQCFIIFAVISIVWALMGYMLVFGNASSTHIIGFGPSLTRHEWPLHSMPSTPNLPPTSLQLLYFAFQLKFAAITPALIVGACAERIRFSYSYLHSLSGQHLSTHQ